MRRIALIIAVVAIGLAIGGYVFFNGERKAPVRYRTATIELGQLISSVSATGTINPVVSVQVGTQVSGMIKSLHADFNSRVKAGDTVAVIDPEPFKARREQAASNLEMARSNVARSKADLAQRKRELDRVQSLLPQQFVSQNDVDVALTNFQSAEAQLRVAEAQVRQAEAALNSAELELKYTVIRSPVDGIVVARNVEVGQTVASSFATPNLFLIALEPNRGRAAPFMNVDQRLEHMMLRLGLFARRNLADISVVLLLLAHVEVGPQRSHARPSFDLDVHQVFDKEACDRRNRLFFLKQFVSSQTQLNRVAVWQSHRLHSFGRSKNYQVRLRERTDSIFSADVNCKVSLVKT